MTRIVVPYEHVERDTQLIHLAVTARDRPATSEWKPALRDVIDGRRVVWIQSAAAGDVWLRDSDGERKVRRIATRSASSTERTAPAVSTQAAPTVWSATLIAPTAAVRRDSRLEFRVDVIAPIVLDGVVHVGFQPRGSGPRWIIGSWQGAAGQHRTVTATAPRLNQGLHRVIVRVGGFVQDAGSAVIT